MESNTSTSSSLSKGLGQPEPFDSWSALRRLVSPLLSLITIWISLTVAAIVVAYTTSIQLHHLLLAGSLLSLLSGGFILFAACMASVQHRKMFIIIYALTGCYILFAMKMFLVSFMAATGHDILWQVRHTSWCYTMALWGQISYIGAFGYTFLVISDILFIFHNPMYYSRNKALIRKIYHICVWTIAICSLSANAIGDARGTCWFLGDYRWSAWAFSLTFMAFVIVSIIFLFHRLMRIKSMSNLTATLLHQSILIAVAFVLSWCLNYSFHWAYLLNHPVPYWLSAAQSFWLGGVGFNNALIWFPFIRKGLENAHKISGSRSSRYVTSTKYSVTCVDDPLYAVAKDVNASLRFSILGNSTRIHPQDTNV